MEDVVARFGRIHGAIQGDGGWVLSRIMDTCEEMLVDRGCTTVVRAPDLLHAIEQGSVVMVGSKGGRETRVHICGDDKVGVKQARSVIDSFEGDVVFVSVEGATSFTRREFEGQRIQFFTAKCLCRNVTRHALVPPHTVVESLPDSIQAERERLPKMFDTDPVAQYYNWKPGTLVWIERKWGGEETNDYYRLVVDGSSK